MPRSDDRDQLIEELEGDDLREPIADRNTVPRDDTALGDETAPDYDTATEPNDTKRRLGDVFSVKIFLLSVLLIAVGVVGGSMVPLVGAIGSLAGVSVAAGIIGLVGSQRRYLETAAAGGGTVGAAFAISLLTTGVLPVGWHFFQEYGVVFAALGIGLGAVLAMVGHYFGRDLRNGLTESL